MSTFKRLLGFLRPYRRAAIASLGFAWLAMGMTIVIPLLVGATVDAVDNRDGVVDRDAILPLALALVGAGILRLGLTVVRRIIAGKVSVAVEFDLRERVYQHLQALELGFFDSQQTGQLMSRATVDLQSIRFFLGYGLIFLTQNALTLLFASVVMFVIQPGLAALALAPVPFVVVTAMRFNRRSRPAFQEVQQRLAELTAEAEESVSGIRIVKAFAREDHMLSRFRAGGQPRVRPERLLDAPARLLLAAARVPAKPRAGGDPPHRGQPGDRRGPYAGRVHGLLHLPVAPDRADADAGNGAWDGTAGGGIGQPAVRDARPRAAGGEPPGRPRIARRRGTG